MYKEAIPYGGSEENSGKLSEYFLLGGIKTESKIYLPYKEAVKLTKDLQTEDPTNPQKPFLKDLRLEIIDLLGYIEDKDMDRVKIYSAVGSPLDRFHKVDMFVEVENENNKTSKIVTFDATIKDTKIVEGDIKADVLIDKIPDSEAEGGKEYLEKINQIAQKAVAVLKAKKSVGGRA